jgi:hypothetical protein
MPQIEIPSPSIAHCHWPPVRVFVAHQALGLISAHGFLSWLVGRRTTRFFAFLIIMGCSSLANGVFFSLHQLALEEREGAFTRGLLQTHWRGVKDSDVQLQ